MTAVEGQWTELQTGRAEGGSVRETEKPEVRVLRCAVPGGKLGQAVPGTVWGGWVCERQGS